MQTSRNALARASGPADRFVPRLAQPIRRWQVTRRRAPAAPEATADEGLQLVLYTKQGCPLCDGLQEKVQNIITRAQFMPSTFTNGQLQVRDISSSARWEAAYSSSVPVLCLLRADGSELELPRTPPRSPADKVQAVLEAAIIAAQ